MRSFLLIVVGLFLAYPIYSQSKVTDQIPKEVKKASAEAHLTFLASNDLRGRGTGSPEIAIAANYIATQFKIMGVAMAPGTTSYFQEVGLQKFFPPTSLVLIMGRDTFRLRESLALLKGKSLVNNGEVVFAGYGNSEDLSQTDVRGKVVVVYAGSSPSSTLREAYYRESPSKYARVREKGGVALIELIAFPETPWPRIFGLLGNGKISLSDSPQVEDMPHLWLANSGKESIVELVHLKKIEGKLTVDVKEPQVIPGRNVIGWVGGTDAKLREEVVVVSAHYDHLGVKKNNTPDSIYNGARDNAIGVTAILETAQFLSHHPLKRSVLVMAACAEEAGLLGSRWYTDHPTVPLSKTVFNLDCDGAGYNDKTLANVVDLNRTTVDEMLTKACAAYGLTLKGDPAPTMNLYERSDNYNFAVKGVPAVDISPGVKGFDDELMKYYHQPEDEAESLDFDYLEKFFRAFVHSAVLIGNSPTRPSWKPGDKFEEAGKKLYGHP